MDENDTMSEETRAAKSFVFCEVHTLYEQLDNNHQNMLEVEMENEDVSGQPEKEVRIRPQTVNKVLHTYNIADQSMYNRVYEISEKKLLSHTQKQQHQQHQPELSTLKDQVKLLKEEKRKVEKELCDVKQQAKDTKCISQLKEVMTQVTDKMSNIINNQHQQIVQKDEMINTLKDNVKQLVWERETQNTKNINDVTRLELELKSCTAANGTLIVSLKESIGHSKYLMDTIKKQEDVQASLLLDKSEVREQISILNDTIVQLQKLESTIKQVTKNNEELQVNDETLSKMLSQYNEDISLKIATIDHISSVNAELTNTISQPKNDRNISEQKIAELTNMLDTKQEELNQMAVNMSSLMNEVKNITDAKNRIEAELGFKIESYDLKIDQYQDNLNKTTNDDSGQKAPKKFRTN